MPAFRFTARWQGVSGLPEDVYENVLYYDVTEAGGVFETISDGIVAAFDAWGWHAGIQGAEVRTYALTGGQPLYAKSYTYDHDDPSGPGEVALCLSYATVANWDATTARRRGRLFLGPLEGALLNAPVPGSGLITSTLALGQALAVVGSGAGSTWMMYSQSDSLAVAIASISVDNAWDTQRRRGLAPTERTVQPV